MRLTRPQVVILLLVASVLLLSVDWGLPSRERFQLLTHDVALTARDFEELDSLSIRYFAARESLDAEARVALAEGIAPPAHRATEVGFELSRAETLRALRRFLLGSCGVDERKPFIALARMNPGAGDLDPRGFMYGGVYLYPLGALLKAAEILGLTSLTSDPRHVLDHPRDIATLYVMGRMISLLAFLGIGVMLAQICMVLGYARAGTLALIAWCCSSLAVNQALVSKPHVLAAFFSFWGLLLLLQSHHSGEGRRAALAGSMFGLAAGASVPALATWVFIPALIVRRRPGRRECGLMVLGLGSACGALLVTNPYMVLNPVPYLATLAEHGGKDNWGYAVASLQGLWEFARQMLLQAYAFPLSLFGLGALGAMLLRGDWRLKRIAWVYLLMLLLLGATVSEPRVLLFLGPVLSTFTGLGLGWAVTQGRRWRIIPPVLVLVLLACVIQFLLTAHAFVHDRQWYPPTREWIENQGIDQDTTIGVFDRPEPVNHPPFPFWGHRIVNLNAYSGVEDAPDLVILGNFYDDRARWEAHPLRPMYRLVRQLGEAGFYELALPLRVRSESRMVGWVYERRPAPSRGVSTVNEEE